MQTEVMALAWGRERGDTAGRERDENWAEKHMSKFNSFAKKILIRSNLSGRCETRTVRLKNTDFFQPYVKGQVTHMNFCNFVFMKICEHVECIIFRFERKIPPIWGFLCPMVICGRREAFQIPTIKLKTFYGCLSVSRGFEQAILTSKTCKLVVTLYCLDNFSFGRHFQKLMSHRNQIEDFNF